ncbi:MAG: branched-chain amino acid transporter AzlD [Lachnospiraceae bacterium]|nr:branched-chain amino acid transporter AzlD [Lachnospiraceae bacterium]
MGDLYIWYAVALIALVTALLRFLPFAIFRGSHKTPKLIEKLSKVLPYAIMGMLVVYCLKDVDVTRVSGFLPALISCLVVAGLHIWKRNTLISIICGTVFYMLLVQLVF